MGLHDDSDWLREQYIENGRSQRDIGEECGVSKTTIANRLDDFGIEREKREMPWRDEERLYELYENDKMSANAIAERWDADVNCIMKWVRRHDSMTARTRAGQRRLQELQKPLTPRMNSEGYMITHDQHGQSRGEKTSYLLMHRLLACRDNPPEEVAKKVVHHKNGVRWLNYSDNIELKNAGKHTSDHEQERIDNGYYD